MHKDPVVAEVRIAIFMMTVHPERGIHQSVEVVIHFRLPLCGLEAPIISPLAPALQLHAPYQCILFPTKYAGQSAWYAPCPAPFPLFPLPS